MEAKKQDIFRLVLRQGITLALIGIFIGVATTLALTRLMAGLLYGISATDPLTFISAAGLLTLTAAVACFQPAWRNAHRSHERPPDRVEEPHWKWREFSDSRFALSQPFPFAGR